MAKSNLSYDGTTPITPHEYKDVWQKAFDHFNDELFGGQLPDAMIVFARNAHSLGHYAPKRYLSRSGEFTKDEISLNQDGFKDRPDETIAGTFVQQMVSHWQQYHGHDKPKKGYHNKEWAAKMKAIGLYPSSTGKPGGSEIGQHVEHYIIPDGAYSYSYDRLAKTGWTPTLESAPRAGSKKKGDSKTPFRCRHCGQNAFGKPSLAILCMDCTTEALPDLKIDWRKLQMVTDEALEAQSYDTAEPEPEAPLPWDDANRPDAETNVEWREAKLIEQAAAPAKRKRGPGRPKGSKNKTRVASYDGNAAPSPEPEFEPDRPKQSTERCTALHGRCTGVARSLSTAANAAPRSPTFVRYFVRSTGGGMAVDTLHLTALEEFYLTLLKTGSLPNYQDGCPEIALTKHLLAEARKQWPLRHLTAKALGFFLRAQGCQKFRTPACNGWIFKPLREARQFWEKRHCGNWRWPESGAVEWGSQCSTSSTLSTCSKGISFDDVLGEAAASVLSRSQDRASRQ